MIFRSCSFLLKYLFLNQNCYVASIASHDHPPQLPRNIILRTRSIIYVHVQPCISTPQPQAARGVSLLPFSGHHDLYNLVKFVRELCSITQSIIPYHYPSPNMQTRNYSKISLPLIFCNSSHFVHFCLIGLSVFYYYFSLLKHKINYCIMKTNSEDFILLLMSGKIRLKCNIMPYIIYHTIIILN